MTELNNLNIRIALIATNHLKIIKKTKLLMKRNAI